MPENVFDKPSAEPNLFGFCRDGKRGKNLNDLYCICRLERSDAEYAAEVALDPRHEVYAGHFPGHPVTPGVCLLAIVRACVGRALGRPAAFAAIKSCKFIAPVIPAEGERLRVAFSIAEAGEVRCTMEWQGNTVLKFAGTLAPAR